MDRAIARLVVGFGLASVLIIYVPAYVVIPWMREGALGGALPSRAPGHALPAHRWRRGPSGFGPAGKGGQHGGGAQRNVAAPGATFLVARRLYRLMSLRATSSCLVAVWLVAGSLGVAVDLVG